LTRVTPEGREPTYLTFTGSLAETPDVKLSGEIRGAFVVGEGAYGVEVLAKDEIGRTCGSKWRIQAKYSPGEREWKPGMPAGAVRELTGNPPEPGAAPASPAVQRLTLMVHAAPLSAQATKLQDDDVQRLVATLSSLLIQVPARFVRVVVFSLDQQKVLFRK